MKRGATALDLARAAMKFAGLTDPEGTYGTAVLLLSWGFLSRDRWGTYLPTTKTYKVLSGGGL